MASIILDLASHNSEGLSFAHLVTSGTACVEDVHIWQFVASRLAL